MRKVLLLTGVALFASANAQAMYWNKQDIKPYIGAEYVYSKAKQGGLAGNLKDNFHSGKADLGMQFYQNFDLEFSYQQTGELKNKNEYEGNTVKNYFSVYALDFYGKYPILCSNFGLLGTAGAAIYHAKYKNLPQSSFNRVGYRAGVGMQYDFNQNIAARVVGRYSYVGAQKINNFKEVTVGMLYRF